MKSINRGVADREFMEMENVIRGSDVRRFTEFMDATNKFSGIILKKAEMENNFNKVYSHAVKKMIEFQFFNVEDEFIADNLLEIFGESGG